ncbi:MAG: PocR ligand-binding domain-containing protein [Clostridia bacterium]|nr:PocR ligand-binding domain-containing protein [Clostridia bacterium]
MIIKYDISKIKAFLSDFHNMTGLTISFWDAEMNQLAFTPQEMPSFCRLIKSISAGKKRCLVCDKKLLVECSKKLVPISSKCHAGLVDTAMPVIYNEQILAFILFGQTKDSTLSPQETENLLLHLSKDLNLPHSALTDAYSPLKTLLPHVIQSTANILHAATIQLFAGKTIDMTDNKLIAAINEYLINNIQNPLSIPILCEEFQISKNRLYALWKKHFNITIGDYILQLRMKKAKNLLTNDDEKINQICIKVGIPDYNYFSKLFKSYYGFSPREYRKRFPLILENKD